MPLTQDTGISPHTLFIENLRSQTRPEHDRLDSLPGSAVLLSPAVTEAAYIAHLKAMYGPVLAAETQVYALLPEGYEVPGAGIRNEKIAADISVLGASLPSHPFTFDATTAADALGVAYVLEGSAMGGIYMFKNLSQALGITRDSGGSFLYGNGPATAGLWRGFLKRFADTVIRLRQEEAVIASARSAFKQIHDRLARTEA